MDDVAHGLYLSIDSEAAAEAVPTHTAVVPGSEQPEPRLIPGPNGVKGRTPTRSEADLHHQFDRNTLQLPAPERTSNEGRVALQLGDGLTEVPGINVVLLGGGNPLTPRVSEDGESTP